MEGRELESRESGQAGVLDRLPFNLTQLVAFAMQKPRNEAKAIDNAIAQLRAMPQFASKAYYSLPFKKWVNGKEIEEIVEGPSIKAATALTSCWGNNIEGGFLGEETEGYIDVSGYFFDYETGKLTIRPWRVSKTYRSKKGEVTKWRYDMLQKQIMAGVSKAIRNADLNGLPAGYVAEYYAEAKRIAARGGKIGDGRAKQNPATDAALIIAQMEETINRLEAIGVERSEIQDYVGRHPELKDEEAVCAHLIGILNAIDDQQTSIEEVFTVPDRPIAEPQRASVPPPAQAAPPPEKAPPTAPPYVEPKGRTIPFDARRMVAKFDSGACKACRKPIRKGQPLWRNPTSDGWEHEQCA